MDKDLRVRVETADGEGGNNEYVAPKMQKHDPVKIVQGSGGCSGLYYTALYYY